MERNEHHNWDDCNHERANSYPLLKLGSALGNGFFVGDVVEITKPDESHNYEVGDRLYISNLGGNGVQSDGDIEVCVTTLNPHKVPEGHYSHGNFILVSHLKREEPVTPEEEAEAIASILGKPNIDHAHTTP